MKKVTFLFKKIIFAFLLLYTYNLVAVSFNLVIPINIFTIGILSILDAPGLILMVIILKFSLFYKQNMLKQLNLWYNKAVLNIPSNKKQ